MRKIILKLEVNPENETVKLLDSMMLERPYLDENDSLLSIVEGNKHHIFKLAQFNKEYSYKILVAVTIINETYLSSEGSIKSTTRVGNINLLDIYATLNLIELEEF